MRSSLPALALLAAACASSTPQDTTAPVDSCAVLFGSPNAQTGLSAAQCQPRCACGATSWTTPSYDASFVARLVSDWVLASPNPEVTADPYLATPPADDAPDVVCAVLPVGAAGTLPRAYRLVTYDSAAAATAAGARPTHFGHCGVCSTLENLAVYMRLNDLTAPVRACGIKGLGYATLDEDVACLRGSTVGFDLPCAQIWAYNTQNTRNQCLSVCLAALSQPYNNPDGTLNDCLRCDETRSGPVFKWIAGRTRRNSGLPNAICRPCSEARPLVHAY